MGIETYTHRDDREVSYSILNLAGEDVPKVIAMFDLYGYKRSVKMDESGLFKISLVTDARKSDEIRYNGYALTRCKYLKGPHRDSDGTYTSRIDSSYSQSDWVVEYTSHPISNINSNDTYQWSSASTTLYPCGPVAIMDEDTERVLAQCVELRRQEVEMRAREALARENMADRTVDRSPDNSTLGVFSRMFGS